MIRRVRIEAENRIEEPEIAKDQIEQELDFLSARIQAMVGGEWEVRDEVIFRNHTLKEPIAGFSGRRVIARTEQW